MRLLQVKQIFALIDRIKAFELDSILDEVTERTRVDFCSSLSYGFFCDGGHLRFLLNATFSPDRITKLRTLDVSNLGKKETLVFSHFGE